MPDGAGAPRDQAPRRDRGYQTNRRRPSHFFIQRRLADLLANVFSARGRRRHARNLGHALVSLDLIETSP